MANVGWVVRDESKYWGCPWQISIVASFKSRAELEVYGPLVEKDGRYLFTNEEAHMVRDEALVPLGPHEHTDECFKPKF